MSIDPIQFAASTSTAATDGVRIAADSLDFGTATEVYVQTIKFGYGTEGVYNQVATGAGLPVAADAANPVFVQITGSGTATQAVDVSAWSATDLNVNLAQTATVAFATAATMAVTGNITASQSTHDSLNANANIQVGNSDATATTPVPIYILDSATGGAATLSVSAATTATQPVAVQNTATVAITGTVSMATTATQPVTITNTSVPVTVATEVKLATDNVIDVAVATTATQPVAVQNTATIIVQSGVITASQSAHDSLNANANIQIGNADATATNPVPIYILTATGGTATQPVSIASTVPVSVATEVKLATDNIIDVSAATTATQPVTIVNTATVSLATDNVIDVSAATTATQPVTIVNTSTNNVLQATATSLNAVVFNQVQRSNVVWGHLTTTATTAATVATGVSNSYNDLSALYITNAGSAAVGISIRDTSTSTMFNHELAADGGGVAMTFPNPLPQSAQATGWVIVLDAAPTANVSVSAAFLTVT